MSHDLMAAFCLVLVIEGLLPFASPSRWRSAMLLMAQLDDRTLRLTGLISMLAGAGLLTLLNR